MDADSPILGKQANILPQEYQNIKRRSHRLVNNLLKIVAPQMALKIQFWMLVWQ